MLMLHVKVKYKGKRYNFYFQGENPRLVELDEKGNEIADSAIIQADFEAEELEQIQVFEADYVHDLREEAKTNRESLAASFKALGIEGSEEVEEFMKIHEELKRNQKGEDDEESDIVKQLRGIIKEKEETIVREREDSSKNIEKANGKWKQAVLSSELSKAVAIPKAANPKEVAIILERFVGVDDEGFLTVYEDLNHTREKLGNDGKKMSLDAFANAYYEDNPHHLIGHTGGGGAGSEGAADKKYFQSKEFQNLPPQERLKLERAREHKAAQK